MPTRPSSALNADQLKYLIREVPDFPKKGILFYDITTLLEGQDRLRHADRQALRALHRAGRRSGARHGSARLYFRSGAGLSSECRIRPRPQARQTSRRNA